MHPSRLDELHDQLRRASESALQASLSAMQATLAGTMSAPAAKSYSRGIAAYGDAVDVALKALDALAAANQMQARLPASEPHKRHQAKPAVERLRSRSRSVSHQSKSGHKRGSAS